MAFAIAAMACSPVLQADLHVEAPTQASSNTGEYCQVVALGHARGYDQRMSLCWTTRMPRVILSLYSGIALLTTQPLSAGRAARWLLDSLR